MSLGPALATQPITSCSKVLVRAPPEQSRVHERLFASDSRRVNLCAAAAPIITCASTCFALSGSSIPAAPAMRMPACGERVGGKFSQRGADRFGCTCSGKVLGRYRGMMQTNGARAHLRSRSLPRCGSRL
eukprot:scaffold50119_cov46-Phaeocystis_antarctica.AAC.4